MWSVLEMPWCEGSVIRGGRGRCSAGGDSMAGGPEAVLRVMSR